MAGYCTLVLYFHSPAARSIVFFNQGTQPSAKAKLLVEVVYRVITELLHMHQ